MQPTKEEILQLATDIRGFIDQGHTKSRKSPYHNLKEKEAFKAETASLTEEQLNDGAFMKARQEAYDKASKTYPTIKDKIVAMENRPAWYRSLNSTSLKKIMDHKDLDDYYNAAFPAGTTGPKLEIDFGAVSDIENMFGDTEPVNTETVENSTEEAQELSTGESQKISLEENQESEDSFMFS